jgi:hypothetical protein
MKLALAITAVLLATTAVARDPTPTEEAWIWLGILSDENDSMTWVNLEIKDLAPLRSYGRKSHEEMNDWSAKWNADLCKHRKQYENDPDKLAHHFDQRDEDEAKRKQKAVDGIPAAIGESDAIAFQSFIRYKQERHATSIGGDTPSIGEMLRTGQADTKSLLDMSCGGKAPSAE